MMNALMYRVVNLVLEKKADYSHDQKYTAHPSCRMSLSISLSLPAKSWKLCLKEKRPNDLLSLFPEGT